MVRGDVSVRRQEIAVNGLTNSHCVNVNVAAKAVKVPINVVRVCFAVRQRRRRRPLLLIQRSATRLGTQTESLRSRE